jgi:hypothetical protein
MAVLKIRDPVSDREPRLFGDFELDRPAGLLLDHGRAIPHRAADTHVIDPQGDQIAAAQLAVDRQVEQREIALSNLKLKPDPDGPDLFRLERALLTDQAALVPRCLAKPITVGIVVSIVASSNPAAPSQRAPTAAASKSSRWAGFADVSGRLRLLSRSDEKRRKRPSVCPVTGVTSQRYIEAGLITAVDQSRLRPSNQSLCCWFAERQGRHL